mgnify:CR=1 FL=1
MADFDCNIDIREIDEMIEETAEALTGASSVKAGYFKGKAYPNGFEIAENALVQEYGTMEHGGFIPPRPFLSNAMKNERKWETILNAELDKGRNLYQALSRVGEEMRRDINKSIDSNIPPPNAQSTIDKKGSSHPLIDDGVMKQSTSYEVEK